MMRRVNDDATNTDQQESAQQAEPRWTVMQTEAGKTWEATLDRAGAKSKDSIDRPSLTAPDHVYPSSVLQSGGATLFQGVTIEGESQVKSLAANAARRSARLQRQCGIDF